MVGESAPLGGAKGPGHHGLFELSYPADARGRGVEPPLALLVAILIGTGIMFFDVMSGFILPIFLALLLVVMFRPLNHWLVRWCKGHVRIAAGLTTLFILFIALIPMGFMLWQATSQAMTFYTGVTEDVAHGVPNDKDADREPAAEKEIADENEAGGEGGEKRIDSRAVDAAAAEIATLCDELGLPFVKEDVRQTLTGTVLPKLRSWLAPLALSTGQFAIRFIVGLCIMMVALYYFFADGPAMMDSMMRLSPLDTIYVKQLIEEFDKVSRAVVVATLASAVAQGVLAGMGYYFVGMDSVFLLMFLTILMAMIPFVGSTVVWLPVCLWLYFYEGHVGAAIGLFIWGAVAVSLVDNVLKPLILHGAANLHPLLALLSVLGGVEALGPIGIFVGPMVVSFMQALLVMVQKELERIQKRELTRSHGDAV
jgi:predicted PurR-regulated permease PerM